MLVPPPPQLPTYGSTAAFRSTPFSFFTPLPKSWSLRIWFNPDDPLNGPAHTGFLFRTPFSGPFFPGPALSIDSLCSRISFAGEIETSREKTAFILRSLRIYPAFRILRVLHFFGFPSPKVLRGVGQHTDLK